MTIVLVRHGATEWSEAGKHTGRTDLPLIEKGEAQAKGIAKAFASLPKVGRVFASPLVRARRTAELAGFGAIEVDPLLLEMDYGDDEGRTRDEIRKERPTWDVFEAGPKNGETVFEVAARASRFLAKVRDEKEPVVIFSHGHFLRIFATVYLKTTPFLGARLDLGPASVSVLAKIHEEPALARWNDRSHC